MTKSFAKKYFNAYWPIELYKFTSFISSCLLWLSLYYTQDNFFENAHFVTLLCVGNFHFYFATKDLSALLKSSNYLPAYFLFQLVSFVGMAFTYNNEYIYLASIPTFMLLYFVSFVSNANETLAQKKHLLLYSLSFCAVLVFESYKKGNYFSMNEFISFSIFCIWSVSTAVWGVDYYIKDKKRIFSKLLSINNEDKMNSGKFDKIFFHDLINHTHALLLFLGSKKDTNNGIKDEDVTTIIGELKLLQDSIQNHFGFEHKNLSYPKHKVPFQIALARVYSLMDAFFPHQENVFFHFRGRLANQEDTQKLRSCTVDLIVFHRIMTNIFKNAYEAHSSMIECIFDYQDDGLHTTVKNTTEKLNPDKINLDEDLGRVILMKPNTKSQGLGLDSISKICESVDGHFSFSYTNGHWISEFFLPSKEMESTDINGRSKAS